MGICIYNRDELISRIENSDEWIGADWGENELFRKYNVWNSNTGSGWICLGTDEDTNATIWKKKSPLADATDEELWQIYAAVLEHWMQQYKRQCEALRKRVHRIGDEMKNM